MHNPTFFTLAEATAKLGTVVRTTAALPDLPRGTRGTVTNVEETPHGCLVLVRWPELEPYLPEWERDLFSKARYDRLLVEER